VQELLAKAQRTPAPEPAPAPASPFAAPVIGTVSRWGGAQPLYRQSSQSGSGGGLTPEQEAQLFDQEMQRIHLAQQRGQRPLYADAVADARIESQIDRMRAGFENPVEPPPALLDNTIGKPVSLGSFAGNDEKNPWSPPETASPVFGDGTGGPGGMQGQWVNMGDGYFWIPDTGASQTTPAGGGGSGGGGGGFGGGVTGLPAGVPAGYSGISGYPTQEGYLDDAAMVWDPTTNSWTYVFMEDYPLFLDAVYGAPAVDDAVLTDDVLNAGGGGYSGGGGYGGGGGYSGVGG